MKRLVSPATVIGFLLILSFSVYGYLLAPKLWLKGLNEWALRAEQSLLFDNYRWEPLNATLRFDAIQLRGSQGQLAQADEVRIRFAPLQWLWQDLQVTQLEFQGLRTAAEFVAPLDWQVAGHSLSQLPWFSGIAQTKAPSLTLANSTLRIKRRGKHSPDVLLDLVEAQIHQVEVTGERHTIGGKLIGSVNQAPLSANFQSRWRADGRTDWIEVLSFEGSSQQALVLLPLHPHLASPRLNFQGEIVRVQDSDGLHQYTLSNVQLLASSSQFTSQAGNVQAEQLSLHFEHLVLHEGHEQAGRLEGSGHVEWRQAQGQFKALSAHLWQVERGKISDLSFRLGSAEPEWAASLLSMENAQAQLPGHFLERFQAGSLTARELGWQRGQPWRIDQLKVVDTQVHSQIQISAAKTTRPTPNETSLPFRSLNIRQLAFEGNSRWQLFRAAPNIHATPVKEAQLPLQGLHIEGFSVGPDEAPFQAQQDIRLPHGSQLTWEAQAWPQRTFPNLNLRAKISELNPKDLLLLGGPKLRAHLPPQGSNLALSLNLTEKQLQGDIRWQSAPGQPTHQRLLFTRLNSQEHWTTHLPEWTDGLWPAH